MKKKILVFLVAPVLFLFPSCTSDNEENDRDEVVIAISSSPQSLNPMYIFDINEGIITELLFPGIFLYDWNELTSELDPIPVLVENWEWNIDSNFVVLKFFDDLKWTDGRKISVHDYIFSYHLYSDPSAQSRFYGSFQDFNLNDDLSINLAETFTVIDSVTLKIKFAIGSNPSTFSIDLPVLPKHVFEKFPKEQLPQLKDEIGKVTSGPFKLKEWKQNQSISLVKNENSKLYTQNNLDEIIFTVVNNYTSSISMLKTGEVDFVWDLRSDDAIDLRNYENLVIDAVRGRDYDYIAWNNIDPGKYVDGKIIPHKLFGSPSVRRALTMAVDRKIIVDEYLNGFGQICNSPISPIFSQYYLDASDSLNYNPSLAKQILTNKGWKRGSDGILEKDGIRFSFVLNYPSGNPLREYTASLIKNNLAAIGIEVKLESNEPNIFFDRMFAKEFDAWLAGWVVQIPLELEQYWGSDLEKNFANVASYQNPVVDELIENIKNNDELVNSMKSFQLQMLKNPPLTFLFWIENIAAYNNRIKHVDVNPLGPMQKAWQWDL
ncbi:MAG: hypothetical protein K8F36_02445 [Melioribacteraceae bacterium]|nr:hypothetical protein [Melioribacteraceae bacterium]